MIVERRYRESGPAQVPHKRSITKFRSTFGQELVWKSVIMRFLAPCTMIVQRSRPGKVLPAGEDYLHIHCNVQAIQQCLRECAYVLLVNYFRTQQYVSVGLTAFRSEQVHENVTIFVPAKKTMHQPVMTVSLPRASKATTHSWIEHNGIVVARQGLLNR